jgi:hypothetical protein
MKKIAGWVYQRPPFFIGLILLAIITWAVAFGPGDQIIRIVTVTASRTNTGDAKFLTELVQVNFWEATGPFPVSIIVELENTAPVSGFWLKSDVHMPEAGERMPSEMKVSLSLDGTNWREIDSRADLKLWQPSEVRDYSFKKTEEARFVRFDVLATPAGNVVRIGRLGIR